MQWSDSSLRPPYFTPVFDPHQGGLGISLVAHVKSTRFDCCTSAGHGQPPWSTWSIGGRRQKHCMLTSIQPLCGPRAARGLLYGTDLYVGANIWSRHFRYFLPRDWFYQNCSREAPPSLPVDILMSFKLANTSFISIAKNSALAAPQASDFKHECIRDSQSIEGDSAVWLLS